MHPKVYHLIFKTRFPKYSNATSMDGVLQNEDWYFYAELGGTVAHCVCTNFIRNLHQVRNAKNDMQLIIGRCCFDNYFSARHKEERKRRRKSKKDDEKRVKKLGDTVLNFTGKTFTETVECNHDVIRWVLSDPNFESAWSDMRMYTGRKYSLKRMGEAMFHAKKKSFQELRANNPGLVNWVLNTQLTYVGPQSDYFQFKEYILKADELEELGVRVFSHTGETYAEMSERLTSVQKFNPWVEFREFLKSREELLELEASTRQLIAGREESAGHAN